MITVNRRLRQNTNRIKKKKYFFHRIQIGLHHFIFINVYTIVFYFFSRNISIFLIAITVCLLDSIAENTNLAKMSLVWTIIATFLYVEIGVVLLLVLPIASPSRWQRFFKSQFLAMIHRQAHIYFVLLLGILVLFLLEAIREMRKYSHNGKWQFGTRMLLWNKCAIFTFIF